MSNPLFGPATRDALEWHLAIQREMRRELFLFLSGLDTVWRRLPAEMPDPDKIDIIRCASAKFFEELEHGLDMKKVERRQAADSTLAEANDRIQALTDELAAAGEALERKEREHEEEARQREKDAQDDLDSLKAQMAELRRNLRHDAEEWEDKYRQVDRQLTQETENLAKTKKEKSKLEQELRSANSRTEHYRRRVDSVKSQAAKETGDLKGNWVVSAADIDKVVKKIQSL